MRSSLKARPFFSFIAVVLLVIRMQGQDFDRSMDIVPADSLGRSVISFERLLNTFTWDGVLNFARASADWSIETNQSARARLIRAGQSSIQREYAGAFTLRYLPQRALSPFVSANAMVVTDNRAVELGRTSQDRGLIGVTWTPAEPIRTSVAAGMEFDWQENQHDQGLSYALGLDSPTLSVGEFLSGLAAHWSESRLERRRPHDGDVVLQLVRDFTGGTRDSLGVRFNTQRREFYASGTPEILAIYGVDYNVFEREMSAWNVANRLEYPLAVNVRLSVGAEVGNRIIDRRNRYQDPTNARLSPVGSRIQEFQMGGSIALDWSQGDWMRSRWTFAHTESEERHTAETNAGLSAVLVDNQQALARRLDNTAARTTASGQGDFRISAADRLQMQISASILRYDTPDTLNTDDRDELNISASLRYSHRFGRVLTGAIEANLQLAHLVYLSRFQSANNQWNRVIRLAPIVEYRPTAWLQSVLRTEVLANYTVSDFEEQVASVRSYSFRQAAWTDSTAFRVTRRIHAAISGSVRLTERGILRWKEFQERPEDYYVEKSLWPRVEVLAGEWSFEVGFRYFGQDRYGYQNGARVFQQSFESRGPTGRIGWAMGGFQRIDMEGWREEQRVNGSVTTTIPNVRLTASAFL